MLDKTKKLLVLGAYGKIGKPLVDLLEKSGYTNLLFPTHKACNLLDNYSYKPYFHEEQPDFVLNLAGKITNINLCEKHPATICGQTLQMNMNLLEICKDYKVEKLLNVLCSCAYPDGKDVLCEAEFWDGSPHESVLAHGLAKRTCYFLNSSYSQQYKMNIVTVALNNVIGGADWTRPTSQKFLDSLVVKIVDAKQYKHKTVTLWGTGQPRREVIYYKDAAAGILKAFEGYSSRELLNLGTGVDYTITEYAEMIAKAINWKGEFIYQTDKPDGQMVKKFNCDKMNQTLNWFPPTSIQDGIKETVKDYKEYIKSVERRSYPLI